ncbi:MAG: hypothetical protein JWQ73_3837 [Variovorax sp.]|jgi:hypothetical protein|nr:hypothetical protein [Variovorax sp.]
MVVSENVAGVIASGVNLTPCELIAVGFERSRL